jgi:hypothetical protein
MWRQHFHGGRAFQTRVGSLVNFPHSSRADRRDDFIWAQTDSWQ